MCKKYNRFKDVKSFFLYSEKSGFEPPGVKTQYLANISPYLATFPFYFKLYSFNCNSFNSRIEVYYGIKVEFIMDANYWIKVKFIMDANQCIKVKREF